MVTARHARYYINARKIRARPVFRKVQKLFNSSIIYSKKYERASWLMPAGMPVPISNFYREIIFFLKFDKDHPCTGWGHLKCRFYRTYTLGIPTSNHHPVLLRYAFRNISKKSLSTVKYGVKTMSALADVVIFLFLGIVTISKQLDIFRNSIHFSKFFQKIYKIKQARNNFKYLGTYKIKENNKYIHKAN